MTTRKIIQKIAKANGTTSRQVILDMNEAIKEASSSTDPQIQAVWKEISPNGKTPSIGTFLNYCAQKING